MRVSAYLILLTSEWANKKTDTYYTKEEFWSIYNEQEYLDVRRKYNAETLPNVYTKVKSTEKEHPQQDLKATWHGLYGHLLGFKIQYLLSGK